MSNTKWRRFFGYLDGYTPRPRTIIWKFVDDERLFETALPERRDLGETHLVDGRFQPFVYKEVQWVKVLTDDPAALLEFLGQRGKFDCEPAIDGLKVFGYR